MAFFQAQGYYSEDLAKFQPGNYILLPKFALLFQLGTALFVFLPFQKKRGEILLELTSPADRRKANAMCYRSNVCLSKEQDDCGV